jgi:hypothetical protein
MRRPRRLLRSSRLLAAIVIWPGKTTKAFRLGFAERGSFLNAAAASHPDFG